MYTPLENSTTRIAILLGYIDDYNITAKSPCSGILGVKKGVCLDGEAHTGGSNNNQIQVSKNWLNFDGIL